MKPHVCDSSPLDGPMLLYVISMITALTTEVSFQNAGRKCVFATKQPRKNSTRSRHHSALRAWRTQLNLQPRTLVRLDGVGKTGGTFLSEKLDVLNAVDKQPARKTVDITRDIALPRVVFSSNHKKAAILIS